MSTPTRVEPRGGSATGRAAGVVFPGWRSTVDHGAPSLAAPARCYRDSSSLGRRLVRPRKP